MTNKDKLIEKQKELIELLKRWFDTDPESNYSKKVEKCEFELAFLKSELVKEQESEINYKTKSMKEEGISKCPICGCKYLMEHRYDSSYKLCMKCGHNWKQ